MSEQDERRLARTSLEIPQLGWANNGPSQKDLVRGDTRTEAQVLQARTAYILWLNDLENIRQKDPWLSPNKVEVLAIDFIEDNSQSNSRKRTVEEAGTIKNSDKMTINTDSDSEDAPDDRAAKKKKAELQKALDLLAGVESLDFYKVRNDKALLYQLRDKDLGQIPGPGKPRINVDTLNKRNGVPRLTAAQITRRTRDQLGAVPVPFSDSVQRHWLNDHPALMRGFPMMEDVGFVVPLNLKGTASNCFWKAVAYQVYGDMMYDTRVKAEHLAYFSEVLCSPKHPKHKLYTEMNKKFHQVLLYTGLGRLSTILANAYQLMVIPGTYQPLVMTEITADLYNLFIVTYTVHRPSGKPSVQEVDMSGSYNARHIFLLYEGMHFQPMVPNEFLASEFRCPRPSWESTFGYPFINAFRSRRESNPGSTRHGWRNKLTLPDGVSGKVDAHALRKLSSGPPPITPLCDEYWIGFVLNGEEPQDLK